MSSAQAAPRPSAGVAPLPIRSAVLTGAAAGAAAALLAFFLPWVRYEQATYSGFDLALAIGPALAPVKAGGLKGFQIVLHAVPVLSLVSLAFLVLGARGAPRRDAFGQSRLFGWSAAAAVAGLAITLLFVASGLLSGAPGTQFAPGLVRTDAAVPTTVARTLNVGAFLGLGVGVYLALIGFGAAAAGSLLAVRHDAKADALPAPGQAAGTWRTQDYVLLAVLAIVFGAVYWWWLQPYTWVAPLIPGAGQVAQELVFGLWFVSGILGGYIIRRPGAAVLANTLAALAEVLLGAPAGPMLVVTGLMQALGPEVVFAATGYRRWGWATMIAAGVAAGLIA